MRVQIKPEEISALIKEEISSFGRDVDRAEVGEVLQVGDGIARVHGLEKCLCG